MFFLFFARTVKYEIIMLQKTRSHNFFAMLKHKNMYSNNFFFDKIKRLFNFTTWFNTISIHPFKWTWTRLNNHKIHWRNKNAVATVRENGASTFLTSEIYECKVEETETIVREGTKKNHTQTHIRKWNYIISNKQCSRIIEQKNKITLTLHRTHVFHFI